MQDFYKILGISKTVSFNEIKKAYRKLSFKYHPDHGGDEDKFKEISTAYKILSNPETKKYYDETGSVKSNNSDGAKTILLNIFNSVLEQYKPGMDCIKAMVDTIDKTEAKLQKELEINKNIISNIDTIKKRMKVKKKKQSEAMIYFNSLMENKKSGLIKNISDLKNKLEMNNIMIKILNDLEYKTENSEGMGFYEIMTRTAATMEGF